MPGEDVFGIHVVIENLVELCVLDLKVNLRLCLIFNLTSGPSIESFINMNMVFFKLLDLLINLAQ